MYTFTDLPPADLNAGFFVLHSSYSGTGLTAKQLTNRLTITVSNTTPGEDRDVGSYTTKTITVTDPPAGANGSSTLPSAGSQAGPESSSSSSLLWTNNAKLHDAMVASLHDALALTNNDTPLLYDSHSALFSQAMASLGTDDVSTAHDTLIPKQHHGFHDLAASDTHTLALTPAASSADTILAAPHHR